MAAYSGLAGWYDVLMEDVDYRSWADYYLALLARAGVMPRSLCDCACGTGAMSLQFAARGIRVTGVDVSGEMLEAAQRRAREEGVQAMFVRQDMCQLRLPRPVDALVCTCDGVNYLLDDHRLKAFFQSARQALRPGGVLAFDISSAFKLEHTLGDTFFGEDGDDVTYVWFNRFDREDRTVKMELSFFVPERDGRYRRFDEIHVQKAHDPELLRALLSQNGFTNIEIFGDKTFEAPEENAPRIHFLAVRE